MKTIVSMALGLLVAGAAASGRAEAATYNLAGTFFGGALITGSFDYDGANFSNVAVQTTGSMATNYTSVTNYWPTSSTFQFARGAMSLQFRLNAAIGPAGASLIDGYEYNDNTEASREISALTLKPAVAVTPLPAALPLAASALAGLGGLGWLKRRRGSTEPMAAA